MKVSIINNQVSFIFNDYKETQNSLQVFYATNGTRIFKVIPVNPVNLMDEELSFVDSYLFAFNKTNGMFDIPTNMFNDENFEKWNNLSQINKEKFYKEVFNIIKRRFVLGYIIKHYKDTKLNNKYNFNDYYISNDIHKGTLADIISKGKKEKFTQSDVATFVEEVCKMSFIPEKFTNDLKSAMEKTFYDTEMSSDERNLLINNILEKEALSVKLGTLSPHIWNLIFDKMNENRLMAKQFYANILNDKVR